MNSGSGKGSWAEAIRSAPAEPGVYIMRSEAGTVLYIGKAKSLKKRAASYLRKEARSKKDLLLLQEAATIEFIVTDSELEALILENSLIKKWKPKFNISLRDDKTYPFLRLSVQEEFPTLTVVRRPSPDGSRYYGPFVPAGAMRHTLRFLRRIFPLRQCDTKIGPRRRRPCLNHQMGRCLGPCAGVIEPEEYRKLVDGIDLFLRGKGRGLAADLRRQMAKAAAGERFEEAALLRDRIVALESTLAKQKVHVPGRGDMDVFGKAHLADRRAAAVLHVSGGRIVGARTYILEESGGGEEWLADFLRAFYDRQAVVPPTIILPSAVESAEVLRRWLRRKRGGRVTFRVPRAGELRKLATMASRNALRALEGRRKSASEGVTLLAELGTASGCGTGLRSLAAVDVSSLAGTDAVAALIWWERGRFVKSRYRRFRIRGPALQDDYAMIGEALERIAGRVRKGSWESPDALLIDGGRGHLSAGEAALAKGGWQPELLLSIAKPREGRTSDAVFSGKGGPLRIRKDSALMMLLRRVRDEAHRFAVTYHRSLRKRRGRESLLDGVRGLGPTRKKMLLGRFGSVGALRKATREELALVPGLPEKVAEAVYRRLRDATRSPEGR